MIFGSIVFAIYLAASSYVFCKVGFKRFDGKVYLSIFGFLIGMGLNLGLCFSLLILDIPIESWKVVQLPQKVEDFVIITVFYSFIYEMRAVWLKMTCDDFTTYTKRKARQKLIWSTVYVTLAVTLALEIFIKVS